MSFKPQGYNSVSPYLVVRDARRTMQFLKEVFDARELRVFQDDDSPRIRHAEVQIDDTVIMLGEAESDSQTHVHVYVPNADAVFAKAKLAGATVVQELATMDDGDRRGGVSNGNGAVWWIAQLVANG